MPYTLRIRSPRVIMTRLEISSANVGIAQSDRMEVMLSPELTVLGRHSSSNVQKVLWTLMELGLPYRREEIGGKFGRTRDADYLALNPNGTVPTIVDGDFVIWESNTVCRYLANRYGETSLYPSAPRQRALCERWMDWTLGSLHPVMAPLHVMLVRTPERQRDPAAIKGLQERCSELFALLDGLVEENGYLSGAMLTLADVAVGPMLHRWFALGLASPEQERLARWYGRLMQRTAYRDGVVAGGLE